MGVFSRHLHKTVIRFDKMSSVIHTPEALQSITCLHQVVCKLKQNSSFDSFYPLDGLEHGIMASTKDRYHRRGVILSSETATYR
jgi:hypothetical protein